VSHRAEFSQRRGPLTPADQECSHDRLHSIDRFRGGSRSRKSDHAGAFSALHCGRVVPSTSVPISFAAASKFSFGISAVGWTIVAVSKSRA
jgi:hypothetical protein